MFPLRLCAVVAKPGKPCGGVSLRGSRRLLFCRYAIYRRRRSPNKQDTTLENVTFKARKNGFPSREIYDFRKDAEVRLSTDSPLYRTYDMVA